MEKNLNQKLYTIEGKETGNIKLPGDIFNKDLNKKLVSQTIVALQNNKRSSTTHAKDRSEVRGGGRKPWRQKGTGRARHGSIRSPIWRGGGVTHGPMKDKVHFSKINRRVKKSTLAMVLSAKLNDKEIIFIDKIALSSHKTKELAASIKLLMKDKGDKKLLLVLNEISPEITRASRNIPNIRIKNANSLTILDMLSFKFIVITKDALDIIVSRLS